MKHRFLLTTLFAAGCTGSVAVSPAPVAPVGPAPVVVATAPSAHPSYLRALSDLRAARGYLARPAGIAVKWDENRAIRQIDNAINEIKRAAIDDGKPIEDHPMVDAGMVWGGRLQKALELVEAARADVNQEEDNAFAGGLRNRAIGHIDGAAHDIKEGIADAGAPVAVVVAPVGPAPKHPAYLHALTDLRAARGWLSRPAGLAVKWDENRAIRELDAAINEIKHASIDDGKPIEDHPPVDVPTWGGRLGKAAELVAAARADVNQEEDNPEVRKLKRASLEHINRAEQAIREGMEDAKRLHEAPVAVVVAPVGPVGPGPGDHPAYLHAMSDLRLARFLLEKPARPDVKWDEKAAVGEIDGALREIREASIDDGKPINDHPPVDAKLAHRDRLCQAMELLHKSAADIEQREDDKWAKGLRNRALGHIRAAENAVHAAVDARNDEAGGPPPPPAAGPGDHPAYLHALSDLRLARFLLEKPAKPDVKWDEKNAISEIDGAINEIKTASIDDGKPLNDHPPVDAKLAHRDRLRQAQELLHKAADDIEKREDDKWAKGLRNRANGHIRNAEHAVHEAMEDRKH